MTDWTETDTAGRIALVQSHYTPEGSAAKIAASIGMGVTRNAVVGVYNRFPAMKLTHPLGGNIGKVFPAKPRREAMAKIPVVLPPRIATMRIPVSAKIIRPDFRHVDLVDLKSGECKWPAGNSPFTFCGASADGSYCRYHARLSYAVSA
jgi:GcrA cell cycle regulator